MAQEQIPARQLNAMLFLFLVGGFDPFLSRYVAADAGRDALLSVGLATGLALGMAFVLLLAARRFHHSDLVEYSAVVLGSPLGQTIGAWYILLLVFGAAQPLAGVGLVGDVALGWRAAATPPLLFLLAVVCALLAGQGLRPVARLSEYAAPAAFLLALVVGLTALGRVDWANYAAVPAGGWGPVWRGAVHLMGRFSLAYILLFLVPWAKSYRGMVSLAPVTILAAGLVLAVGTLPVGLYSGGVAAVTFIPALQLLADSVFGAAPWLFHGAVELWLLGLLLSTVIALRLLAVAQDDETGLQRFLVPAAVAWTGLLLWSNAGASYTFGEKYFRYLSFPAAIGWPLLLFLGPALRRLWTGEYASSSSRSGYGHPRYGFRFPAKQRARGTFWGPLWTLRQSGGRKDRK